MSSKRNFKKNLTGYTEHIKIQPPKKFPFVMLTRTYTTHSHISHYFSLKKNWYCNPPKLNSQATNGSQSKVRKALA